MTANRQYVGFKSRGDRAENTVPFAGSFDRATEITFTILNEAFVPVLRYQDSPDLCSLKCMREMANSMDRPLKRTTGSVEPNWDDYRYSHFPKTQLLSNPEKHATRFLAT